MKPRTGAYALILQEDKILLTQKKAGPHIHLWDLPGGGIEFTETPVQALHRELQEEVALSAETLTLLTVLSVHGPDYHHIGIIYRAEGLTSTGNVPEEEGFWFSLSDLDQTQLTPFVLQLLSQKCLLSL